MKALTLLFFAGVTYLLGLLVQSSVVGLIARDTWQYQVAIAVTYGLPAVFIVSALLYVADTRVEEDRRHHEPASPEVTRT